MAWSYPVSPLSASRLIFQIFSQWLFKIFYFLKRLWGILSCSVYQEGNYLWTKCIPTSMSKLFLWPFLWTFLYSRRRIHVPIPSAGFTGYLVTKQWTMALTVFGSALLNKEQQKEADLPSSMSCSAPGFALPPPTGCHLLVSVDIQWA